MHVHLATFIFGLVFVVISPIMATCGFFLSMYALLVSRAIGTLANVFILLGNHLPMGLFYMIYLISNGIAVFIELIYVIILLLASFGLAPMNGFTGLFLAPVVQQIAVPLLIVLVVMCILNIYAMTPIISTWLRAFDRMMAAPAPAKVTLRAGDSDETIPLRQDSVRTVFL
ncbi:unnamed protein product [Bursaphelenchus xylophilus]|uniref:(pine wood nematode) hypothetical protein n=1 Tax=Bursaphelenchus xylophilus TaxID=6326 RepID=A0A1I7SCN7_BURXY|nr:unnamed protein product [Bursaphelenchus xylophilus]CAG9093784.1 unnamed protein product [Bursaphelenchus xylophilus]